MALAATPKAKSRLGIWRPYFTGNRVNLFHRGYVVLAEFANTSQISTEVLTVLERAASLLREPLKTMFDVVMSTVPGEEVLREEMN